MLLHSCISEAVYACIYRNHICLCGIYGRKFMLMMNFGGWRIEIASTATLNTICTIRSHYQKHEAELISAFRREIETDWGSVCHWITKYLVRPCEYEKFQCRQPSSHVDRVVAWLFYIIINSNCHHTAPFCLAVWLIGAFHCNGSTDPYRTNNKNVWTWQNCIKYIPNDLKIHGIVFTCSNLVFMRHRLAVPGKAIKYLEHPNRTALIQHNLWVWVKFAFSESNKVRDIYLSFARSQRFGELLIAASFQSLLHSLENLHSSN